MLIISSHARLLSLLLLLLLMVVVRAMTIFFDALSQMLRLY